MTSNFVYYDILNVRLRIYKGNSRNCTGLSMMKECSCSQELQGADKRKDIYNNQDFK